MTMRTIKRIIATVLLIVLIIVVGYFVFTGSRLTELHETAKEVAYAFKTI